MIKSFAPLDQTQIDATQRAVCLQRGVAFEPSAVFCNSGFALSTDGMQPVNGLRHAPTHDTTGWYIWCGEEWSDNPDFFKPVHTGHLYETHPELKALLGLPPGYRFLWGVNFTDIWSDPALLNL